MHNNYYFLRHLSAALETELLGYTLVSCFCQNKDELIIEFNNASRSFFLKATLQPGFQCLSFPDKFHRAKKNSVDIFPSVLMSKVVGVRQFQNERSFAIILHDDQSLVFKMFGAQSNVICFSGTVPNAIFSNHLTDDLNLTLDELDREIDFQYEAFAQNQDDLPRLYFTFGKSIWKYLGDQQFSSMDLAGRWNLIQQTLHLLEAPSCNLTKEGGAISLSLLPSGHTVKTFRDPLTAVNEFFHTRISTDIFLKQKAALLSTISGKRKHLESFLEKKRARLELLNADHHYQQVADLIMANLATIKTGQERIELANFYDNDRMLEIKLRRELNPQQNAALLYRKGKNQTIEIRLLKASLQDRQKELDQLTNWRDQVLAAGETKALREISALLSTQLPDQKTGKTLPYHEFEYHGFRIWVGKNAAANDQLTLKHSFKDDLWLHARDVAGSHVLLKYQAGKPFPKDVIARAASLAAYHSKRRNESLCPVAVTLKKFVRKRKGDPPGMVVVEREEVMMVEPAKG